MLVECKHTSQLSIAIEKTPICALILKRITDNIGDMAARKHVASQQNDLIDVLIPGCQCRSGTSKVPGTSLTDVIRK